MEAARNPVIECDDELNIKLRTHLQFAITGKPVYRGDSLFDLVKRHCPDIYDIAYEEGFTFLPSTNSVELEQIPPRINFNVVRYRPMNEQAA